MLTTAVPYEEAAEFLAGKPAVTRRLFDQLLPELKARAFTIMAVDSADALQAARDAIATIPRGGDWPSTKKQIAAALEPWLGEGAEVRTEMLMRWHAYQAYAVANVRNLDANADLFPFRQYQTAKDGRVRASHAALEGIALPHDSPFWDRHTPPWEYGCRCDVRGITAEEADEIREADAGKDEQKRRVLEGPLKDQLEQFGRLQRGDNEIYDVRTPSERGETGVEWSSKDLTIPLDVLKSRYDADVWAKFTDWAEKTEIDDLGTVWKWLSGEAVTAPAAPTAVAAIRPATAADLVAEVMAAKTKWTRAESATFFSRMEIDDPRSASDAIDSIKISTKGKGLAAAEIRGYVDDVLRRLPRSVADTLPKLEVEVIARSKANWLGSYTPTGGKGRIRLNSALLTSADEARETAYHELMHWVHRGSGDDAYRKRIAKHFQTRKAAGGKWIDSYAGKIYPWEDVANPGGLEVPTVYFERFADPAKAADAFNEDPDTMLEVLSIFFT
jgi:hypothetical protein